ncbi:MAG: DegT/DnrJ/EryC1/StrS family aminotransferase [Elusimicrobiota bacterium]
MKKIPFGDLAVSYKAHKKELDAAIQRVLDRGWYILGEELQSFEKKFASYCGSAHAVGVGSGTEALHLALVASSAGPGDEVITVPNTAVPTVSAISFSGATPKFVDIDQKTYTMDPSKLEAAITPKTKAIIPVHLFGHCCDMDLINEIAKKYNITVIEDACQAHGAQYKTKKSGILGKMGCFSFYPSKNLGAYGDGGMITTDDKTLAEKLVFLRNYGQEKRYFHKIVGFNSRLDEIQAAVLEVKLPYLDEWNQRRRQLAGMYVELLGNLPEVVLPSEAGNSKHIFHLFVIKCKDRDNLQKHLAENGVGTLIHYPVPVHLQKSYRFLGYPASSFPIAEKNAGEILSLPMYPELFSKDIEQIAEIIKNFYKGGK